jgi:hypothetical protein
MNIVIAATEFFIFGPIYRVQVNTNIGRKYHFNLAKIFSALTARNCTVCFAQCIVLYGYGIWKTAAQRWLLFTV